MPLTNSARSTLSAGLDSEWCSCRTTASRFALVPQAQLRDRSFAGAKHATLKVDARVLHAPPQHVDRAAAVDLVGDPLDDLRCALASPPRRTISCSHSSGWDARMKADQFVGSSPSARS